MTRVFFLFCFFFGGSLVPFLILPPALGLGTPAPHSPSLQLMAQMWTQPSLTQLSGRATDRSLTQWRTSPSLPLSSPHLSLDTLRTPRSYSPRRHFLSWFSLPFHGRIFFSSTYARNSLSPKLRVIKLSSCLCITVSEVVFFKGYFHDFSDWLWFNTGKGSTSSLWTWKMVLMGCFELVLIFSTRHIDK